MKLSTKPKVQLEEMSMEITAAFFTGAFVGFCCSVIAICAAFTAFAKDESRCADEHESLDRPA